MYNQDELKWTQDKFFFCILFITPNSFAKSIPLKLQPITKKQELILSIYLFGHVVWLVGS